jgi:hypothetical protein
MRQMSNTGIYLNGKPMVWVTVDEHYDPETGDCRWQASITDNGHDFLMPLEDFDGTVPDGYWEAE